MIAFTNPETWYGGFYELSLEYPTGSTVTDALACLWRQPALEGCYIDNRQPPTPETRVPFTPALRERGHVYGIATLADGARVACGTCTVNEIDDADWLCFYLPMGALGHVYPVEAFPFGRTDHSGWRDPLDAWLAALGRAVYERVPFRLGVVGFEVSAETSAAEIAASGIPERRGYGLLLPTADGLAWHPKP